MKSSFRLAGAAALAAALLLTACAKKTDQTTTASTDTTTTTPAPGAAASPVAEVSPSTTPDVSASVVAAASGAPAASATSAATTGTASSGSNGTASGRFITLPVYPGASETKDQDMSVTTNTGSVEMKVYAAKDDSKKVAEWYKAHLPQSFKGGILTSGDKTVGTFADEHDDGDQSVIVAADSNGSGSRIQLTTKHGK
ncbi:MAG TPA: hypothetical protein VGD01_11055 [Candidatus Elarobacter sp.]|jgi:hypothetical protein